MLISYWHQYMSVLPREHGPIGAVCGCTCKQVFTHHMRVCRGWMCLRVLTAAFCWTQSWSPLICCPLCAAQINTNIVKI